MPDETIEAAEIAFAINETIRDLISRGELKTDRLPLLQVLLDFICDNAPLSFSFEQYFRTSHP